MFRKTFARALLGALILAGLPAAAQLPSTTDPLYNNFSQRTYLKTRTFSRTVTVDAGGRGQYATVGAALAWVATQTRTASTQFLVLVYNGSAQAALGFDDWYNYSESPFVVPTYTTVQGVAAGHSVPTSSNGAPQLIFTSATGPLITLGDGSSLVNLDLKYVGTPSAPLVGIDAVGAGIAVLTNVALQMLPLNATHAVTGIRNADDDVGLYLYNSSVVTGGVSSASSVNVDNSSSTGTAIYDGRFYGGTCAASFRSTAGIMKLFDARVDTGCTVQLATSGAGTIEARGVAYTTSSGTGITHSDGIQGHLKCPILSGAGAPEGAVTASVCALYVRTDGGAGTTLCVKESGTATNTGWICK